MTHISILLIVLAARTQDLVSITPAVAERLALALETEASARKAVASTAVASLLWAARATSLLGAGILTGSSWAKPLCQATSATAITASGGQSQRVNRRFFVSGIMEYLLCAGMAQN